ncbi:MAG: SDR family NAD(P)-dependent oxidoreductase [Acidimicrobiia bacterium]|nr:SDR family NAD(P)-dependent oxidoreductase [Acidimicrobiia bacterium]
MSDQRVAVLTGGTGSLGTALARRLAATGHRLAVTYVRPEESATFETNLDLDEDQLLLRRVDASQPDEMAAFLEEIEERYGAIDIVCGLVGGWAGGRDIEETSDVRWERMLDLNLRSAFITLRAAIPYLRKSQAGRLVFIGSRAAQDTPAGQAAFNVAKAGVVALARSAAAELDDTNITVNAVMPSVIDTPTTRETLPFADYVDWPTPDEIAAVIEFLASPASAVISGAMIPVYGKT